MPTMNTTLNINFQYIIDLITQSQGQPITLQPQQSNPLNQLAETYAFLSLKKYQPSEIEDFEKKLAIRLPTEYKNFLILVGACHIYIDKYQLGIKFHPLEQIEQFTKEVFMDLQSPFPNLLLIASNLNNGDIIGYNLNQPSKNCLAIYSIAEQYPEHWIDYNEFTSLNQLLDKLIISHGEDYYL